MSKEFLFKILGVSMIQKDLVLAMKRNSWMIIQLLYLLVLGFVLAVAIIAWDRDNSSPDSLWSTVSTAKVVSTYLFCQVMVICVIFPFLAGNSITREKSEQTWALLRTTALTPGELVRGKYFALVSQCLYVMLLSAPLLVMTTLLGGVSLNEVLLEYMLHIVLVAWICAVGVLTSSFARKGAGAILGTPLFFFFPMMFVIFFAGNSYFDSSQMMMSQVATYYANYPVESYIIASAIVISAVAALMLAVHTISSVNSIRSIQTRFGVFLLYIYIAGTALYYFNYRPFQSALDFNVATLLVGGVALPLLRIAGGESSTPLGVRQFSRERPVSARFLIFFLPGGMRSLLLCFLILLLFVPLGSVEVTPRVAPNANVDLTRVEADINYVKGIYYSVLFWLGAVFALAWFLGQCGCSSILSASLAFTVHFIALLVMTVLSVRFGHAWSAFSPNVSVISTPFNMFDAMSYSGRNFQRGFPEYFGSSIRMDTLFNIAQIVVFSGVGCLVAFKKKNSIFSQGLDAESGLLLDLPKEDLESGSEVEPVVEKPPEQEENS